MIKYRHSIEVFILAGGKSKRMQRDKASLYIGQSTLLERSIALLEKMAMPFAVVSSNSLHQSDRYPVFKDLIEDKGPMGGLYTAIKHTKADKVMLMACDMPGITEPMIEKILRHALESDSDIIIPSFGQKLHPLLACYHKRMANEVELRLIEDNLRMHDLVLSSDHQIVSFDGDFEDEFHPFINLNTIEEYQDFLNNLDRNDKHHTI
jgi:molybdenum cofactor guanylyltransferase